MCGITGFISERKEIRSHRTSLEAMVAAMLHRGPDSSGEWVSPESNVWLGHARLAIQDISPAGHQPMVSPSRNLVLTYNGEIYNHRAIRTELDSENPHQWRGTSDTETLLFAIERWGLNRTLLKMRGMFAFALYDQSNKTLTMVRDRFGEKPLYYGFQGKDFLFASDLAALVVHPSFRHEVDREALAQYFLYGYVPSPASIYKGIHKLLPGHYITLTLDNSRQTLQPTLTQYWSYAEELTKRQRHEQPRDAVTLVQDTLRSAVADQMISDVPIGTFLSGGLDSSVITALAQENSGQPINTYTIGSPSADLDESGFAREVARALGTRHTEFQVTDSEARDVVPLIGEIYSEPFADSSQIPTYIVSKMARGEVTVALTGDGGDEIFGGYNRYTRGLTTWRQTRQIPGFFRHGLRELLLSRAPEDWAQQFRSLSNNGARWGVSNLGNKIEKIGEILLADTLDSYYMTLTEKWPQSPIIDGPKGEKTPLLFHLSADSKLDDARRLMLVDALTYLPDDILVKVDRASMASGLETRAPFLDLQVAEIAATLNTTTLIKKKSGKSPLRQILKNYLPDSLINRPKLGFGIPLGHWLRGPLKTWVEALIDPAVLKTQGFLDPILIDEIWANHQAGMGNTEEQLWAVLVFQLWLEHNPKAH